MVYSMELSKPIHELVVDGDRHESALNAIDGLIRRYSSSQQLSATATTFVRLMEGVPLQALIEDREAQAGLSIVLAQQAAGQPPKLRLGRNVPDALNDLATTLSIDNELMCLPEQPISQCFFLQTEQGEDRRAYFFIDPMPSEQTARSFLMSDQLDIDRHHDSVTTQNEWSRLDLEKKVGELMTRLAVKRSKEDNERSSAYNLDLIQNLVVDAIIRQLHTKKIPQDAYPGVRTQQDSDAPFTKALMRVDMRKGGPVMMYNYITELWEQEATGLFKPSPVARSGPEPQAVRKKRKFPRLLKP